MCIYIYIYGYNKGYIYREIIRDIYVCVCIYIYIYMASLVTQKIKNLPAVQETQIQSLGQEDPLEKGMANHSSMLAWKIPWTENPRLQFAGLQRTGHD